MGRKMKRMATLVGCNYFNSPNELHGCINDVQAMRDLLVTRFDFDPANIELLTDDAPEGSPSKPTGANIRAALGRMVDQAKSGDVLFFHYSGHGTRLPVGRPGLHPFRMDEAIVPCDLNLITDVDFRRLVNRIPRGASLTILSDSCHSGGLIDKEKEQIGPATADRDCKPTSGRRAIHCETILGYLTSISGASSPHIGDHLLQVFGPDASIKFRANGDHTVGTYVRSDEGILLSGCQANETSADMDPKMGGGKAYGAFSNAVQMIFREHQEGVPLSNREVVRRAREILKAQGFKQHPCLYSSDENADAPFLDGWPKHATALE